MEGSNAGPDRGHVYYQGRPLCDDDSAVRATSASASDYDSTNAWDIDDAHVICKMMGFSKATNSYHDACPFGACPPRGIPFAMSGFKCTGSENNILDCPHDATVASRCGNNGVTGDIGYSNSPTADIVAVKCE